MKKIYKVLNCGTGDEFFVSSTKKPKLKNLIQLIAKEFCYDEENVLEMVETDDILLDEIKPISVRAK